MNDKSRRKSSRHLIMLLGLIAVLLNPILAIKINKKYS